MFGMTEARTPDGSERGTNTMGGIKFGSAAPADSAPAESPPNISRQVNDKLQLQEQQKLRIANRDYVKIISTLVPGNGNPNLLSLSAADQAELIELAIRLKKSGDDILRDIEYFREEARIRARSRDIPRLEKKVNELTAQHDRVVEQIVPLVEERDRLAKEIQEPAGDLYSANRSLEEANRLRNQRPDLYPAQTE